MGVCVPCVNHTLSTGELGAESAGTGIPRTSERVSAVPSSSQLSRPRAFHCHERLRRRGSQAWGWGRGGLPRMRRRPAPPARPHCGELRRGRMY